MTNNEEFTPIRCVRANDKVDKNMFFDYTSNCVVV